MAKKQRRKKSRAGKKKKSSTPVIGIIVCFVLLFAVGGGWYFVKQYESKGVPAKSGGGGGGIVVKATGPGVKTGGLSKSSKLQSSTSSSGYASLGIASKSAGFSPDDEFEAGEVLVANPPDRFAVSIGSMGFSVIERVHLTELDISVLRLSLPAGMNVKQARKTLRAKFPGLNIDANHYFEAQGVEDYQMSVPRALVKWRPGTPTCGGGIRIGMIDASVDVTHPALKGQRLEYRSFHKQGRRPGPADHGTAVAAILIGKPKWGGLLPGAELIAANMFEITESGRVVGNGMALLKAINWMSQKRVQVINMSVAGADNKIVRNALNKARAKGLVMVAAAGNWGKKGNKPAFPAAYKDVLAITAFGTDKKIYASANLGKYIDFAAPGVGIYTAVPGGGRIQSGTSFASPFVTVLLALQIERGGAKKSSAMREFLRKYVVDLGAKGKDETFGWGFVNLQPRCS